LVWALAAVGAAVSAAAPTAEDEDFDCDGGKIDVKCRQDVDEILLQHSSYPLLS